MLLTLLTAFQIAPPALTTVWQSSFQDQFTDLHLIGQTVFFGTNKAYGALSAVDGKRIWVKTVAAGQLGTRVGSDGKTFVVSIGKGPILAMDAATGKPKWSLTHHGYAGPVAVIDGACYLEPQPGTLVKMNAVSKKQLWLSAVEVTDEKDGLSALSIPAKLVGTHLYVGTRNGLVKALNPDNGHEIWQAGMGTTSVQGWTADEEQLYVTTDNGTVAAHSLETGGSRWRAYTQNGIFGDPLYKDGRVYVTSLAGYLACYGGFGGAELWRRILSPKQDFGLSQVVPFDGGLFMVQRKKLLKLNLEGYKQWELETNWDLFGQAPVVIENDLLLRSSHEVMRVHLEPK